MASPWICVTSQNLGRVPVEETLQEEREFELFSDSNHQGFVSFEEEPTFIGLATDQTLNQREVLGMGRVGKSQKVNFNNLYEPPDMLFVVPL